MGRAPDYNSARRYLTAAICRMGRERKAKAQASDLLLRDPKCTIARTRANNPFRHEWMISYFLDALALAGVPVRLKVSRQDPLSRGRGEDVGLEFCSTMNVQWILNEKGSCAAF